MNFTLSPEQLKRWQEEDEGCVSAGRMTLAEAFAYAKQIAARREQGTAQKPRLKEVLPTTVTAKPNRPRKTDR